MFIEKICLEFEEEEKISGMYKLVEVLKEVLEVLDEV